MTNVQLMLLMHMKHIRRDANEFRIDKLGPSKEHANYELDILRGMRHATNILDPLRYRVEDDAFMAAKNEIRFLHIKYQEVKP